jgi:cAMP-dependent protein kinase regulator
MAVDPTRIATVPLFDGLDDAQRATIAGKLEERAVHSGEHLSSEGGAGYFFFVIESGSATVSRHNEQVAVLGAGDFFGEGAIFRAKRRNATVTATEPMVVSAMFGADFAKLASDIPQLHERIEAALDARLPAD